MDDKPITLLLQELREGEKSALNELLPVVYAELRRLAGSYLRSERANHTLQPTALVHEAYLRLVGQEIEWQNRSHFFGVAARSMREILIDYARSRNSLKRGGEHKTQIVLNEAVSYGSGNNFDVLEIDEALKKLESLDKRQAQVVEMKFFGGLKIEEIAEVLSISPATVKREWATAKMFLSKILKD